MHRVSDFGLRDPGFEFWVPGLGFGVWGEGFGIVGFGFQISGFGIRESGSGSRVSDFGIRFLGFGSGVSRAIGALSSCRTFPFGGSAFVPKHHFLHHQPPPPPEKYINPSGRSLPSTPLHNLLRKCTTMSGLVFEVHGLWYHSTLGLKVTKKNATVHLLEFEGFVGSKFRT